jgi:hypothetical protein
LATEHELKPRWGIALASVAAAGALAWWLLTPSTVPPDLPDRGAVVKEVEPAPASLPAAERELPSAPPQQVSPASFTVDGVPIMPADAKRGEPGMAPHPHTPQHERIYRENSLIGDLNGAMDVKDARGMRQLLEQYREEYPEDEHEMQRGYELIADCFEKPGPETRAAAQRYYDEALASGLRRYIRRYCLE